MEMDAAEQGELFVFESGAFVSWNMSETSAREFADSVLRNIDSKPRLMNSEISGDMFTPVEVDRYREEQTEAMDYIVRNNQATGVKGDCIIIGESGNSREASADFASPPLATAIHPPSSASGNIRGRNQPSDSMIPHASGFGQDMSASKAVLQRSENDLRARLTLSRGLARSTKLAVYEEMLDSHMDEVEHIPAILAQGSEGPLRKKDIVRITGNLLKIRQYLYLNDENLIDMPEMFWSSPELEVWFKQMTTALDVELRMRNLRTKLDYSLELQDTLLDLNSTKVSHRLEWIIIVLIAIEIGLALMREGVPGFRSNTHEIPHTRLLEEKKQV